MQADTTTHPNDIDCMLDGSPLGHNAGKSKRGLADVLARDSRDKDGKAPVVTAGNSSNPCKDDVVGVTGQNNAAMTSPVEDEARRQKRARTDSEIADSKATPMAVVEGELGSEGHGDGEAQGEGKSAASEESDESELVSQQLAQKKVGALYHFTPAENFESIKERGILSIAELSRLGLRPSFASSDCSRECDAKNGLQNHIHLSFTPSHPMMFKGEREMVILQLDIKVVDSAGVLFTDQNAVCNDAVIDDFELMQHRVQWDIVKHESQFCVDECDRRFYQAEVLVPTSIATVHIQKYCMFTQGKKKNLDWIGFHPID